MMLSLILTIMLATHYTPISEDKILTCFYNEDGYVVSQIWTFTGNTLTKGTKHICTLDKYVTPISVRTTGKNTFEMIYGKRKTRGIITGDTITYLDFGEGEKK